MVLSDVEETVTIVEVDEDNEDDAVKVYFYSILKANISWY
jgi:hypothetical protein